MRRYATALSSKNGLLLNADQAGHANLSNVRSTQAQLAPLDRTSARACCCATCLPIAHAQAYWNVAPPAEGNTDVESGTASVFFIKIKPGYQFVITDLHDKNACMPGATSHSMRLFWRSKAPPCSLVSWQQDEQLSVMGRRRGLSSVHIRAPHRQSVCYRHDDLRGASLAVQRQF